GPPGEEGPTGPTGPNLPFSGINVNKNTALVVQPGATITNFNSTGAINTVSFELATGIATILPGGAGRYSIACYISVNPSNAIPINFIPIINNVPATRDAVGVSTNASGTILSFSTTVPLNVNDNVRVINNSTVAINIPALGADLFGLAIINVYFTMHRIN
ncbi:hypothetical protein, partial [Bacillus mycoides]|uniref:hypothetical protein n=1 Tax=Bacillus mycoides TaxID=1405 RepID=UPI001485162F